MRVSNINDVTESKAAQAALVASENNYRLLADNVIDVIWTADLQGKTTFVSPSVFQYRGVTVEEALEQTIFDSLTPESALIVKERLAAEITSEEGPLTDPHRSATLVVQQIHKDGTTFWGEVRTTFLRDSSGKPIGLLGISRDVTERVAAEKEVRNAQERLNLAIEGGELGMWDLNLADGSMNCNERWAKMVGFTIGEVEPTVEMVMNAIHPADRERVMAAFTSHLEGKKTRFEAEHRWLRESGEVEWCLVRAKITERDKAGNPQRMTGAVVDITERKQAEEALSDVAAGFTAATGKEFFTSLTKHIHASLNLDFVMISQISRENPEVADTRAVCAKGQIIDNLSYELPGTPCEEVLSGTICFHPDGVQQEFPEDELLLEMGVHSYMGIPLWASNGEPLGLMALLHSGPFPNEELARSMLRIFSVRTAAELERMLAEEKSQRLVTAIDQADEDIMVTSTNGDIEYVNPAFERITGYGSEEVLGKNPRLLSSGEHDKNFYQNLWDTISRGEVWKGRIKNRKKDGTFFQEEATISPVFEENGKIINYVAVKRDVTKELQLEHQLRQTQKMEAIGTLAGGIAHDFNNILFAILGNADMALERLLEEGQDVEEIKEIITAGNRAKDLVAQILAFARKTDLKRAQVDICLLVKEVSKLIRSTFPSTIEVKTTIEMAKAIVIADPTNLHQVLMNICTNARHAMLESGGKLELNLTSINVDEEFANDYGLDRPGQHVVLEISDTGGGIPKQIVDRIFEPFFTTKNQNEGTGLGLSMVHGIVADLGGMIFVYSEHGVGTTFKVFLPQESVKDELLVCPLRNIVGGKEKILVVDDEPATANISGKMLASLGYSVKIMTSGTEALNAFNKAPLSYDLLFTDQTMPGISGEKLAIEAMKTRPDLPVILCTGFSEIVSSDKVKHIGIREFLTKPISKRELASALRNALDRE